MAKNTADVPLYGGVHVASVDIGDLPLVSGLRWHALKRGSTVYAKATLPGGRAVLMHRLILGAEQRQQRVDHRDANGLNNTRANLRLCTHAENLRYARRRRDSRTGFKGVGFNTRLGRYHAHIQVHGRSVYLGSFSTAEDAHAAYRRAADEHYGEFARFE